MCLATLWKSFALCHVVSAARPPSPRRWSCWEAAGLGEGLGCAPCTSSVFLARAPPDCGPARAVIEQKLPGCAPARGTRPRGALGGPFAAGSHGRDPAVMATLPNLCRGWVCWGGEGCTHGCSHSGAVERATGVAGQSPEPGGWRRGVGDVGPPQPSGHRCRRAPLFPCGPLVCVPSTDGNKIVLLFITRVGLLMLVYVHKRLAGHPHPPPGPLGKRRLQGGAAQDGCKSGTTLGGLGFSSPLGLQQAAPSHTRHRLPILWEDRGCSSNARTSGCRQNPA